MKGFDRTIIAFIFSGVDSEGAGGAKAPLEFWSSEKGAKPDFCLSEFNYYSKHLWIWKAIYGADFRSQTSPFSPKILAFLKGFS